MSIRYFAYMILLLLWTGCNLTPKDKLANYKGLKHPKRNNGVVKGGYFVDDIFQYKIKLPEGWRLMEGEDFIDVAVGIDETFLFGMKKGADHFYVYDIYLRSDTYSSIYKKFKTSSGTIQNLPTIANTYVKLYTISNSYDCFDELRYDCFTKNDDKFYSRYSWLLFNKNNKHIIAVNQIIGPMDLSAVDITYRSICQN